MRTIALDTETTGLDPSEERIVEIACIVIGLPEDHPDSSFHCYLNPEKSVSPEAQAVHGLGDSFLANQPVFAEVVEAFLAFVQGAEVVIHNADFDCGFLDKELGRCGKAPFATHVAQVIDSLKLARKAFVGKKNTLTALAQRLEVERDRHREGAEAGTHSALADARLLGDVYLALQRGQQSIQLSDHKGSNSTEISKRPVQHTLLVLAEEAEVAAHQAFLATMKKPLWPVA